MRGEPDGHRYPYSCPCGQVILTTTTLMYIEPTIDKDGRHAKIMLEMIKEAWDRGDKAPYINAIEFDRRLNSERPKRGWFSDLLRIGA